MRLSAVLRSVSFIRPRGRPDSSATLPPADRYAARFVALAAIISTVVLYAFLARHSTRIPYNDEFSSFRFLFGEGGRMPSEYWRQHNEHRIPLPRVIYVATVLLSGNDFRAPVFVNAALLVAATVVLLNAVRRVRGRWAYTDAAIPLTALTTGQWENLVWGFQIQFILSSVLALVVLALAVRPGLVASPVRVTGIGVAAVGLSVCGANGVALVPALGCGLLLLAWHARRLGHTRSAWAGLVGGTLALVMVPVYFHGLTRPDYLPPPARPVRIAVCAVNLLGVGLFPATPWYYPPGFDGITLPGFVAVGLVLLTGGMLFAAARDPARRPQSLAAGCVLAALLCLVTGLAYGRASVGNILGANRYTTLMMPVVLMSYVGWVACSRGWGGKLIPAALLIIVATAAVPNAQQGNRSAAYHVTNLRRVEYMIREGVPISFVADAVPYVFYGPTGIRRDGYAVLRQHGVVPFDRMAADPNLREEWMPLRVTRCEGMTPIGDGYVVTASQGFIEFALPRHEPVYGLKMIYQLGDGSFLSHIPNVMSWDPDDAGSPRPGYAVGGQLQPSPVPTDTRVYVRRPTDRLRVTVFGTGNLVRVLDLSVLHE